MDKPTGEDYFFQTKKIGRQHEVNEELDIIIINLRKKNYSTNEILTIVHSKSHKVSYNYVYRLLKNESFAKLPRRSINAINTKAEVKIEAPKSKKLRLQNEKFNSQNVGILMFLPLIEKYGISKVIEQSLFPETRTINRLSSIMSFIVSAQNSVAKH